MNHRSKIAAIAISGLFAVAPLAGAVHATESKSVPAASETAATTPAAAQSQIMETSHEVYGALRNVQAARMAIFNGTPDVASSLVADAVKGFEAAGSQVARLGIESGKEGADRTTYVPFETSMGLAEDFVPSQDNAATLQQASDHLAKGDQKQAAEVLKNANIDVTVTAAMVPVDRSMTRAKDAMNLIRDGKYYEANLALKDIEDSILVEAYAVDAIPAQGTGNG